MIVKLIVNLSTHNTRWCTVYDAFSSSVIEHHFRTDRLYSPNYVLCLPFWIVEIMIDYQNNVPNGWFFVALFVVACFDLGTRVGTYSLMNLLQNANTTHCVNSNLQWDFLTQDPCDMVWCLGIICGICIHCWHFIPCQCLLSYGKPRFVCLIKLSLNSSLMGA